jgi:ubiquinone/menaquinone biosynthesis C-methylase UbiE
MNEREQPEPNANRVPAKQVKPAQARTTKAKPAQAKTAQAKPAQAKPAQARTTQAKAAQAKTAQAKPAQARTTQARTAQARKTPVKKVARVAPPAPKPATAAPPATARPATRQAVSPLTAVGSAEVAAAEMVEAPEVVAAEVETAEVETDAPAAASAEDVQRAWQDNELAQVLYHDWEAGTYDEKWSISFDDRCIAYARDRFSALVGSEVLRAEKWPYRRSLEIGSGTGFFSLNLKQAGVIGEVHVSDVSAGMVESAQRNARGLGFEVQGVVAGAEKLPYEDSSFDLVVGHAVIHHIPDVESALREVLRVLRPGGRFVIAGEPTRIGDWYARRLGRITWKATTVLTQLPMLREKWAKSPEDLDASSRAAVLEAVVDLHTFVPGELAAMAERVGAVQVHTQTEELLAAILGWPVRTFEAAVNPKALGWGWATFAYQAWRRLSAIDRVLAKALPQSVFYNVGVTGRKRSD